ncbi:chloride channel protein [Streptomyces sp. MS06]|uniref:chloride channel protein n=1 Tax=Streptomyces sp. MS06 TaxID=3385974 RepID=UPI0039A30C8D
MTSAEPSPGAEDPTPDGAPAAREVLHRPGYRRLLLLCLLLGVLIALASFFFVSLQHGVQRGVWEALPEAVGYDRAPWWWPMPALLLAGLIAAPIITRLPGGGGHLPVNGLGGPSLGPEALPGVVVSALTTLPLGVVLGPEAPLMALGSGLALLAARAMRQAPDSQAGKLLGAAGSTAAISTILGGPVTAAVLVVEGAGFGGSRLVMLLLPCLLTSAAGAVVFTGFGHWTGLSIGALTLPELPPNVLPDAGDFLWGVPASALIAVLVAGARSLGRRTARATREHTAVRTVGVALAVGGCLTAYALLTGRNPEEAALSGQKTLAQLAGHPGTWSIAALVALVACKGLAWSLCLGALRGGPIFPATLLGAAVGIACSGLPGLGTTPGLALGIAAGATVITGLPLSSSVLTVLLLGSDAHEQMPLIVTASVVAFVTAQLLPQRDTGDRTGAARP